MHSLSYFQSAIHDAHFKDKTLEAAKLIVPYGLSGAKRLNIYRNNTFITLTDALSKTFPVINKLVGDDFFSYAAGEFIKSNLPKPGPLFEYGESFAGFLGEFEPASTLPYLSDVAHLEWAINLAYHAAEASPLYASDLIHIAQDKLTELRFDIHPSCNFLSSDFAIDKIWQVNQPGAERTEIELKGGVEILIIRPRETVRIHIINPGIISFLNSLQRGQNVEDALMSAMAEHPQIDVTQTMIDLLETGVFVAFELAQEAQN